MATTTELDDVPGYTQFDKWWDKYSAHTVLEIRQAANAAWWASRYCEPREVLQSEWQKQDAKIVALEQELIARRAISADAYANIGGLERRIERQAAALETIINCSALEHACSQCMDVARKACEVDLNEVAAELPANCRPNDGTS